MSTGSIVEKSNSLHEAESIFHDLIFSKAKKEHLIYIEHQIERTLHQCFSRPTQPHFYQISPIDLYMHYIYTLVQEHKYKKSLNFLQEMKKNYPISTTLRLEEADIYKRLHQWTEFKNCTDQAIKYAYRGTVIGHCYRNYGYMCIEEEDYDAALSAYLLAIYYDPCSTVSQKQIQFIIDRYDKPKDFLFYEDNREELFTRHQIPIEPNREIKNILFYQGQHEWESGNFERADFCFSCLYEFTHDPDVEMVLSDIREMQKLRMQSENAQ